MHSSDSSLRFLSPNFFLALTRTNRPRNNDVTLSVLRRAKAAGFIALVATLDTFLLAWPRPHDLDMTYLPFAAGISVQVGTSDPVFMRRQRLPPRPDERPAFPLDLYAFRARDDLAFLRANRDGPIVLNGIQAVDDANAAMDAHVDGIVVSNHGACSRVPARS
jgi:lactate 2-monooxygenase